MEALHSKILKQNKNKNLTISKEVNFNFFSNNNSIKSDSEPINENEISISGNKETSNESDNTNNSSDNLLAQYNLLLNKNFLGRFKPLEKFNIINKLSIIIFEKIKRDLSLILKRKKFTNELLKLKNSYKDKLIQKKLLYSIIQQKMFRDFNCRKKLKDLRKKLMDEKIERLRYRNQVYIMRTYGIYRPENYSR